MAVEGFEKQPSRSNQVLSGDRNGERILLTGGSGGSAAKDWMNQRDGGRCRHARVHPVSDKRWRTAVAASPSQAEGGGISLLKHCWIIGTLPEKIFFYEKAANNCCIF